MRIKHGGKREPIFIKITSVDMCYHVVHRIPVRKISMMNISWWTIILLFEFPNKNTNPQLKRISPVLRLYGIPSLKLMSLSQIRKIPLTNNSKKWENVYEFKCLIV